MENFTVSVSSLELFEHFKQTKTGFFCNSFKMLITDKMPNFIVKWGTQDTFDLLYELYPEVFVGHDDNDERLVMHADLLWGGEIREVWEIWEKLVCEMPEMTIRERCQEVREHLTDAVLKKYGGRTSSIEFVLDDVQTNEQLLILRANRNYHVERI